LLQLVAWLSQIYATAVNLLAFVIKVRIVVMGGALVATPLYARLENEKNPNIIICMQFVH
jgi:hypothetical protein